MIYLFIKNNKSEFPIEKMAHFLSIPKSSYYRWLSGKKSIREKKDSCILEKIKVIYTKSKKTYGAMKITMELKKSNLVYDKKKIARIMSKNQIFSIKTKKFRIQTTVVDKNATYSPNLLDRKFQVNLPNKVWVSDITYIQTKQKVVYLCTVLDLYSRKIVGWAMADNMKTSLVVKAFTKAYRSRKPETGLLFHSDRGSQYTSKKFRKLMELLKINQSMSRKGNCWDNSCAESFFGNLKTETVYPNKMYLNEEEARADIFQYIEIFYNKNRSHSYLGFISPEEYEMRNVA